MGSTLLLRFDRDLPVAPLPGVLDGDVVVVCEEDGAVSFERLRGLLPDPLLASRSPEQVVVHTLEDADLRSLLAAVRYGGRVFHLVDAPGTGVRMGAAGALLSVALRRLRRGVARLPLAERVARELGFVLAPTWPDAARSIDAAKTLAASAPAPRARRSGPARVVHYLGALGKGGAERQLVYLARGSVAAGHVVEVWTAYPLEPDATRHVRELEQAGVRVRVLPLHPRTRRASRALRAELPLAAVDALERHAASPVLLPLVEALLTEPPDVLHCWLDEGNAVGGLAGLTAGIARIVLAGRNVSPRHMPHLDRPWLRETYRALAANERVRLVNNSQAGAHDYADWLELPRERIAVIENALPLAGLGPGGETTRAALAIPADAFVVAGLFRLAPEKRPHDFLEVLARVRRELPGLVALHVGDGPLAAEVRARSASLGLDGALRFLGARDDPWSTLGAVADATLLSSGSEGIPNAALESQACRIPVVLTRAGGAAEAVEADATGILREPGDVDGLALALLDLARDPGRRRAMGERGRAFVAERFAPERTLARTLALY